MVLTNNTALGIAPDINHNGVSDHVHRKIIQHHWNNPGIAAVQGSTLEVRGRNDLKYDLTAGMAVVCRDANAVEGYTEAYVDAMQVGPVAANTGTNPRIDTVWIRANDIRLGDTPEGSTTKSNRVEVGVAQGTPATSPKEPTLPARAMKLRSMRVPAGATTTKNCTPTGNVDFAVPYGASLGILTRVAENKDKQASSNPPYKEPFLNYTFYVPTDRWIFLHAYLCVSTPEKNQPGGVAAVHFYLDGQKYTTRKVPYTDSYETYEPTTTMLVSAGTHTVGIAMYNQAGTGYVTHYGQITDASGDVSKYVGRVLVVKDEGVAR